MNRTLFLLIGCVALLTLPTTTAQAGYADGMNLYRAYFVPGGVDPMGNKCEPSCESTLKDCLAENVDLLSQIYFKGCTPPKFSCLPGRCKKLGVFDYKTNRVPICWRVWLKNKKKVKDIGSDFCDYVVRHELTHALDNCHGLDWEDRGCEKRVCSEIRAYSASKLLCQSGEGKERDKCLMKLISGSISMCGRKWAVTTTRFDKAWKKCYVKQGGELPAWPHPDDPDSPWIPPKPPLPGEVNALR